jgi:hypothetical protein
MTVHLLQAQEFVLDTIIYWDKGERDDLNQKQGLWQYFCTGKTSKVIPNILSQNNDTIRRENTQCYRYGYYSDNNKVGEWITKLGACDFQPGSTTLKIRREKFIDDGSVIISYREMMNHWEYEIAKDSSKLNGKIEYWDLEKTNYLVIEGFKADSIIKCQIKTIDGEAIDKFEYELLEAHCFLVFSGYYDRYLNKTPSNKPATGPGGE